MPGRIDFDLRGAAEMERIMRQLGPRLAGKAGASALRAGAKVIQDEAKRLVPKKTRALERSIVLFTVPARRRNDDEQAVQIGFRPPVSRRAHLVEFGTQFTPARPFIRPALDSKASAALDKMRDALARALRREAEKLARGNR